MRYIVNIVFFFHVTVWGQSDLTPLDTRTPVQQLTLRITENIANDSLKVAAIYKWITDNVAYDRQFRNRVEGDSTLTQEPDYVVTNKKAVCVGYSKLFKEMCRITGIQAVTVEGFTKGDERYVDSDEHAWNVVNIHSNWYLIDATWGASSLLSAKKFFLADPSVFANTHLPHDPLWQLLKQPIGFDCFMYGKKCYDSNISQFNVRDTIQMWISLDSLTKNYNEATRILRYNPIDVRAMRQLAEYYSHNAMEYFRQYAQIRQDIKDKIKQPDNKQAVLALLESATLYLEKSKEQYQRILPFAKKNRYTDAHMNIDVLNENLANIEQEKAFVMKYFK